MRVRRALWPIACWLSLVPTGCGQHVEKKHETLVSPSQEGTPAQREPEDQVRYGEVPPEAKP